MIYMMHIIKNRDNDKVREVFLKCLSLKSIDGQHILATCIEIVCSMTNDIEY